MTSPLPSPAELPTWEPLSLRRILRHFEALTKAPRADTHLNTVSGLLPDERLILRFLHAVYGGSMATIQLYARYIAGLANHARRSCVDMDTVHVDAYIHAFERRGAKPATCGVMAAALRSFYRHLHAAGLVARNPMALYKKHRQSGKQVLAGHLSHSLSEADIEALMKGLTAAKAPARDVALFHVLFMTGLRAEELVSLQGRHLICWQGQWYLDVHGKGSKERRVYVPAPALAALHAYRLALPSWLVGDGTCPLLGHLRHPERPLTRHGVYVLVKKWCSALVADPQGKAVSPHWFRHSCFTQLALKGVPLEAIKTLAGHESVETTMRYNEAAALMDSPGKVFEK